MSRLAPLSLALALAFAAVPAVAAAHAAHAQPASVAADGDLAWSVEPVQGSEARRFFEYAVDPGTQVVDKVVITNSGTAAADFLVYATDAINIPETGAFGLLAREDAPTDAGAWITMEADTIRIEPGMQAIVPFNLLIPSDATPGEHVAGIVASVVTTGESEGAAVALEQRVGARLYLTVSGAIEPAVEVEGLSAGFSPELNPFAAGSVDVSYSLRNAGNVRLDVAHTVTVDGPFGIRLAEFEAEPFTELLPRQTVRVTERVPAIVALLLSFTTVTATPSAVGTLATADASPEDPTVVGEAAPVADEAETLSDDAALDFAPAAETTFAFAISWTMVGLVVLALGLGYLVWRYVAGTRDRLYLAIEEAEAAASARAAESGS